MYAILFALWRYNSLRVVRANRLWAEALPIALNYAWLALCLPPAVAVGHIFLAGLFTATIVTVTHQTEEMFLEHQDDWVRQQIESTRRDQAIRLRWLWGGMQYQLEHHLFPTMPRYNYPRLVPVIKAFCNENDIGTGSITRLRSSRVTSACCATARRPSRAPATRADNLGRRRERLVGRNAGADADNDGDTKLRWRHGLSALSLKAAMIERRKEATFIWLRKRGADQARTFTWVVARIHAMDHARRNFAGATPLFCFSHLSFQLHFSLRVPSRERVRILPTTSSGRQEYRVRTYGRSDIFLRRRASSGIPRARGGASPAAGRTCLSVDGIYIFKSLQKCTPCTISRVMKAE